MIIFRICRSSSKKRQDKESGKLATRKSPHYHNTLLEAPDGQPLCVCATGKAEWYISKGLGVKGYMDCGIGELYLQLYLKALN